MICEAQLCTCRLYTFINLKFSKKDEHYLTLLSVLLLPHTMLEPMGGGKEPLGI